jgi:exosortase A-associated hydrolase 1
MSVTERAESFTCAGETLVGVMSLPAEASAIGVVIVVGGPQYRAGSHRQFVKLARGLAEAGYPVLRFDCRGMGDSGGAPRSFEDIGADIGAAIDRLASRLPEVRRIVLWGLCDGASAALLYCEERDDPRVAGLCLVNPWVRTEVSLARTQVKHYYAQRLLESAFWAKLLRGGLASDSVKGLFQGLRTVLAPGGGAETGTRTYVDRMAASWRGFKGQILLVLSGRDYTAKEFIEHVEHDPAWAGVWEAGHLERHDLPEADHTLSHSQNQAQAQCLSIDWLEKLSHA